MDDRYEGDDGIDYSKYSHEELREHIIWYWLYFLQKNELYREYCKARRTRNEYAMKIFESRRADISQFFEDWGDVVELPDMDMPSPNWSSWYEQKKNIFSSDIKSLGPKDKPDTSQNTIVTIPHGLTKQHYINSFKIFLDGHPEIIGVGPRYSINVVSGSTLLKTLVRLAQIDLTYRLLEDENYNYPEVLRKILMVPGISRNMEFNWFPTNTTATGTKKDIKASGGVDSHRQTLMRHRKSFDKCINSSIDNMFPPTMK